VGPTARGEFDARARERLAEMGEWLRLNGRSVYGCGEAPEDFDTPQDCRLTYNPDSDRLYLHVFSWPAGGELFFEGAGIKKVKYAQLLCDGSETIIVEKRKWQGEWEDYENSIILKVPVKQPSVLPVIEIILE
jgi:alpha-L-fucosidase